MAWPCAERFFVGAAACGRRRAWNAMGIYLPIRNLSAATGHRVFEAGVEELPSMDVAVVPSEPKTGALAVWWRPSLFTTPGSPAVLASQGAPLKWPATLGPRTTDNRPSFDRPYHQLAGGEQAALGVFPQCPRAARSFRPELPAKLRKHLVHVGLRAQHQPICEIPQPAAQ